MLSRGESNLREVREVANRRPQGGRGRETEGQKMRGCARSRFVSLAERRRGGGGGAQSHEGPPEVRRANCMHPLSRPLNPRAAWLVRVRLPRSIVRPFYSFASRTRLRSLQSSSRLPFAVSLSPTLVSRCHRADAYTVRFALFFFFLFSPAEDDRPAVRPSVRSFGSVSSGEKAQRSPRLPRPRQGSTRLPLGFPVDSLL